MERVTLCCAVSAWLLLGSHGTLAIAADYSSDSSNSAPSVAAPPPSAAMSPGGMAGMDQQEHSGSSSSHLLEFFPSLEALSGLGTTVPLDRDPTPIARVDTILGYITHRVHLFGEYLVTTEPEHEMERLQLGYELDPDTLLWVGRYHSPASAWNTEHHHGQYLQTSITRPNIARWEDEQGLLPQHIAGALLESHREFADASGLQIAAGVGAAPTLNAQGFAPIDVDGKNHGPHRLAANARIAYLPDYLGTDLVALLWAHNEFAVHDLSAQRALQATAMRLDELGAQFDWTLGAWHMLGAGYFVQLHYDGLGAAHSEHFEAGYLQAERLIRPRWTAYARIEPSSGTGDSRLVHLIGERDDWAYEQELAGMRWDFMRRQAVTVEYTESVAAQGHYHELRLQWSAAWP